MQAVFDINNFHKKSEPSGQYERQLQRLTSVKKDVVSIEAAVRGTIRNLQDNRRSFVIYGEPQSGKTEMMICLTAKLLDEGHQIIVHLLNDSVDLLGQNLGRFKTSGLAPAARNFSEVLDPAFKIRGQTHVIFCKKNGSDLKKLIEKLDHAENVVVVDDEADYASPNGKVNSGGKTKINELITHILGATGVYIGVTATPARLDLNNTFDNDNNAWIDFPPHRNYTGQDIFFPLEGATKYQRTLLSDSGADPKYARQALFGFLVNAAQLNLHVNDHEECYSLLVHTSGKKIDHRSDWHVMHQALGVLVDRSGPQFIAYTRAIWDLCKERYPEVNPNTLTSYILDNISRHAIVVLNSERDWKDNSGAATSPQSLFTIIIGGNIVSRGVTLNNLLSMFFTRDVKHKIQQDTYIQRARMFGSRSDYLRFFELTMPQSLYLDWHRCFVFHRLALMAIKEGLGSLVWLGDNRIAPAANGSIDRSTVDLDRGEISFGLFELDDEVKAVLRDSSNPSSKLEQLSELLGDTALPLYLRRYIERTSAGIHGALFVHDPMDVSAQADDAETITRRRGFIGQSQVSKAPRGTVHHVFVLHNKNGRARIVYKFVGNIQFIRNTAHDS
ncbi:Z1 domain-containing protein [Lysobacter sp. Root667]|uniref:Z1 domain-containing protein n=1 Tax=Lysobacter sp. Root667 TaxID=1736581 RepID=UPI0009EA3249|nr:Z1 domain-containing protein [Lysobacter sp. Root667]